MKKETCLLNAILAGMISLSFSGAFAERSLQANVVDRLTAAQACSVNLTAACSGDNPTQDICENTYMSGGCDCNKQSQTYMTIVPGVQCVWAKIASDGTSGCRPWGASCNDPSLPEPGTHCDC